MDRPRTGHIRRKRNRRIVAGCLAAIAIVAGVWALSRIGPAAPLVDAASVFTDTVRRGEMLRQVRGVGTLVPETVIVIAATEAGRIERRLVEPGRPVQADTVLLELGSPLAEQEHQDAEAQLRGGRADLANLLAQLEDQRLTQESVTAKVEGQYLQAKAQYDADLELSKSGLTDKLTLMKSEVAMAQLRKRLELERAREDARKPSRDAQVAAQEARIEQMEALVALRRQTIDRLRVRAGMAGVLQQMEVEVGQLVAPGDILARVSDPARLKAELRIPETLVDAVAVGQRAEVDTRNGVIEGEVARIDPAAVEGTVLVDVMLTGDIPRAARPDLGVDGTIELERLDDVLFVGRPVQAREDSSIGLFRFETDGVHAERVIARIGKVSVGTVEVVSGLAEGDSVILSDMRGWSEHDRIRVE